MTNDPSNNQHAESKPPRLTREEVKVIKDALRPKGLDGVYYQISIFAYYVFFGPGYFLISWTFGGMLTYLSRKTRVIIDAFMVIGLCTGFVVGFQSGADEFTNTIVESFSWPRLVARLFVVVICVAGTTLLAYWIGQLLEMIIDSAEKYLSLLLSLAIYLCAIYVVYFVYLKYFDGTPNEFLDTFFSYLFGVISKSFSSE